MAFWFWGILGFILVAGWVVLSCVLKVQDWMWQLRMWREGQELQRQDREWQSADPYGKKSEQRVTPPPHRTSATALEQKAWRERRKP